MDWGPGDPFFLDTISSPHFQTQYLDTISRHNFQAQFPDTIHQSCKTFALSQGECSPPQCPALVPPAGGQVGGWLMCKDRLSHKLSQILSHCHKLSQIIRHIVTWFVQVTPKSCSQGSQAAGTKCSFSCDPGFVQSGAKAARSRHFNSMETL